MERQTCPTCNQQVELYQNPDSELWIFPCCGEIYVPEDPSRDYKRVEA